VSAYVDTLDALGDPTRRGILELLRLGPRPVGAIAAELPVSRPAVSQHLRILEAARLVRHRRDGTRNVYALDPDGLADLRAWVETFWDDALARFADAAERRAKEEQCGVGSTEPPGAQVPALPVPERA
jgi:DNA-binding transcriptional ArsR family regulator